MGSAHINAALIQVLDGSGSGVNTDNPCKPGRDGFGDFIVTVRRAASASRRCERDPLRQVGKINDVTKRWPDSGRDLAAKRP